MIHTGYSFKSAVGHLPDVISRLKTIGWDTAPIADRCSTFGFTRWRALCEQNGMRPVYGVELPVTPALGKKVPMDFWTFLAIDSLTDLHRLINLATANSGTDGNEWPLLTYAQAHAAQGVIKISGHAVLLDHVQADDPNYYFGLTVATAKGLLAAARAKGLRPIAASCNAYPTAEDKNLYRVAMTRYVKRKETWITMGGDTQTYPQHILSDNELTGQVGQVGQEAIATRQRVLSGCTATLTKASLLVPPKPKTLRQMCEEGAATLGCDLTDSVYAERLDRELKMIAEKKFEDYFYIVADLVAFAKERMIVGPARGSSAGSLVCYLLGITAVDPIPYGLLFERFVDLTRTDLPDIDIDFSDANRELVFDYAKEKYGADRVARLGTVAMYEPKSALKKVAIALNIPQQYIDKVTDSLILRSSGDTRAMQQIEDTLNDTEAGRALLQHTPEVVIAAKMEGHPNTASRHAAGIVLTQEPVINYVAIDARNNSVMCDKRDAAALDLLKIDALGLTQLSVFERTLELLNKPTASIHRWLEQLPRDDAAAFNVLNRQHFAGIFQFNGVALQNLAKQILVESLNDIVAITALGRPGPMATGGSGTWVRRRTGMEPVAYPHPLLEPYLKETLGVVVYQETVMQVGREIGDLTWKDVTALRKAMSKSLGTEYFNQFGDRWKASAIAKGIQKDVAEKFWFDLCAFGSWGFNKCLAGSTRIALNSANKSVGRNPTIAQLYKLYEQNPSRYIKSLKRKPPLISLFPDGRGWPQYAAKIMYSGEKICWRYIFDDRTSVTCTPDHIFWINGEEKRIGDARIGDLFTTLKKEPSTYHLTVSTRGRGQAHAKGRRWRIRDGNRTGKHNVAWTNGVRHYQDQFEKRMHGKPCQECGATTVRMEVHHNDFNDGFDKPKDLDWLCVGCHKRRHYARGRVKRWEKGRQRGSKILVKKVKVGLRKTYDIAMPKHHNFLLANGLVTHNSHAVSYALVSYWCCYLKAHHPVEFAAATLDAEDDPTKQILLLRELANEGVSYIPVDKDLSTGKWQPLERDGKKLLLGPLSNIAGIGPKGVEEIITCRSPGVPPLSKSLLEKLESGKTLIDSLTPISDRLRELHPNGLEAANIITRPTPIIKAQNYMPGEVMIIGVLRKLNVRDENEATNVERRGGRVIQGPDTTSLLMTMVDDTDQLFCKIYHGKFSKINAQQIIDRGRTGKAIYAVKGNMARFDFRMMWVNSFRYLGDMSEETYGLETGGAYAQSRQQAAE